jgi:uncharacterized membrane protein
MSEKVQDVFTKKKGRYHFGLLRKQEYHVGDVVPFSGVYECLQNEELKAFKKGEIFSIPDEDNVSSDEVQWVATDTVIDFISKNLNVEWNKVETVQQHIADWITERAGSMSFVYFHAAWFAIWIFANNGYFGANWVFDPFPYGLLTMVVSLEAIFLATFIMVSQNTQMQRGELRADLEYQINLKAEKEIAEVLALLKELKEQEDIFEEEEIESKLNPKSSKGKLRDRLQALKKKRELSTEELGIRDMDA